MEQHGRYAGRCRTRAKVTVGGIHVSGNKATHSQLDVNGPSYQDSIALSHNVKYAPSLLVTPKARRSAECEKPGSSLSHGFRVCCCLRRLSNGFFCLS